MLRLKERIEAAEKALESFESSLLPKKPTSIERDAAIRRFEFTVEAVAQAIHRNLPKYAALLRHWVKGIRSRITGRS